MVLPVEDFDLRRKRRSKRYMIKEHVAIEIRQSERCFYCGVTPFSGARSAGSVRDWLVNYDRPLWNQVVDCFRRRGMNYARLPRDWSAQISAELRGEILLRLDFSKIQVDHLIPVYLLQLMEGSVSKRLLGFAGRDLAVPACEKCNRGRTLAGMMSVAFLLKKWAEHYFDGNLVAARADPKWQEAEPLINQAHGISRDLSALRRL